MEKALCLAEWAKSDMTRGGRSDRQRAVEPVPTKPAIPIPNRRSGVERRKKDGLGILPRATTPEERHRRRMYNQAISILLVLGGVITMFATLSLILMEHLLLSTLWPYPLLGLILAVAGVGFAQRPERRREDRRQP